MLLRDGFRTLRSKRLILGSHTQRLILRLQAAAAAVSLLAAEAVQAVF